VGPEAESFLFFFFFENLFNSLWEDYPALKPL
jgi:hypothetical protein